MMKLVQLIALVCLLTLLDFGQGVFGAGSAVARVGRPLTPFSYAGVARRQYRRGYYGGYGYAHPYHYAPGYAAPYYGGYPRYSGGYYRPGYGGFHYGWRGYGRGVGWGYGRRGFGW